MMIFLSVSYTVSIVTCVVTSVVGWAGLFSSILEKTLLNSLLWELNNFLSDINFLYDLYVLPPPDQTRQRASPSSLGGQEIPRVFCFLRFSCLN